MIDNTFIKPWSELHTFTENQSLSPFCQRLKDFQTTPAYFKFGAIFSGLNTGVEKLEKFSDFRSTLFSLLITRDNIQIEPMQG